MEKPPQAQIFRLFLRNSEQLRRGFTTILNIQQAKQFITTN